jgi:hypothetical protein
MRFAKQLDLHQVLVGTSSIGPGALNRVIASGTVTGGSKSMAKGHDSWWRVGTAEVSDNPAVLNKVLGLCCLTICNAWFSSFLTTRCYAEVEKRFISHRDSLHAMGKRVIGAAEQGFLIQGKDLPVFDAKPRLQ